MLSTQDKEKLEKQQYRMVGSHSTVKVCGWTKHILKGEGGCYKFKFYGINTLRCLQMSTCLSCANRCVFCWRDYKASVAKDWEWDIDEPQFIFDNSLLAQKKLLEGFGGNSLANQEAYEMTKDVAHVALSLTGEPIIYPKLNELLDIFHNKKISSFIVTNGQYPNSIANVKRATQLYLSVDAVTPESMKEISKPLFPDYWKRFNESLDEFSKKDFRKAIRITLIKNLNDDAHELFAKTIERSCADIVEVKAYMHVGASQDRLPRNSMPHHCDVVSFCRDLVKYLPNYSLVSEHIASKVVLLARKSLFDKESNLWNLWINFEKFFAGEKTYNAPVPKEFHFIPLNSSDTLPSEKIVSIYDDEKLYHKEIKRLIDEEKIIYLPLALKIYSA
jgi:tRNA wybutosine-synthesizing protein 1